MVRRALNNIVLLQISTQIYKHYSNNGIIYTAILCVDHKIIANATINVYIVNRFDEISLY